MEVEAALEKAALQPTWALKGTTNLEMALGHMPGTLRFDAFTGARQADGLYHGHYHFTPGGEGALADWSILHMEPEE